MTLNVAGQLNPWRSSTDNVPIQRSNDRILVLRPIDGKPLTSKGILDKRLFKDENNLHAVMDPQNCMWSLKYDSGIVPPELKQKFTSFRILKDYVTNYFKLRNVDVVDVIDVPQNA